MMVGLKRQKLLTCGFAYFLFLGIHVAFIIPKWS